MKTNKLDVAIAEADLALRDLRRAQAATAPEALEVELRFAFAALGKATKECRAAFAENGIDDPYTAAQAG